MGTRSLINVIDGKPIVTMYQQNDGYPSCVGKRLAEFLAGITMINGISGDQEEQLGKFANGIECLAAQIVAQHKECVGGTYLMAPGADAGQEYEYDVTVDDDGQVFIECFGKPYSAPRKSLHKDTPTAFVKWCLEYEGED